MKKPVYLILLLLLCSLILLWQLFGPFLKPASVALLLAIAINPINCKIQIKTKNRLFTTIMATLMLSLLFFVPVAYFIIELVQYINTINVSDAILLVENSKKIAQNIPSDYSFIKVQLINLLNSIDVPSIIGQVLSIGTNVGKNSFSFISEMIIIIIFYSLFVFYSKELVKYVKELLPLEKIHNDQLFNEISSVMGVVFYSIIITALLEGFLFGLFVSFFGYSGFLTGMLYGFSSLIPVIGGVIMWIPISSIELVNGNTNQAIYIALYSIIFISIIIDAIVKPIIIGYVNNSVVKKPTSINEIIIFMSIIAGLSTFGFWGMIIGPATVAFFISITNIIKKEFLK